MLQKEGGKTIINCDESNDLSINSSSIADWFRIIDNRSIGKWFLNRIE